MIPRMRISCVRAVVLIPILLGIAGAAAAQSTELPARADATLFEDAEGALASGAGQYTFAGRTGQDSGSLRRSLFVFDLSSLPADATITRAEVRLTTQYNGPEAAGVEFSVHQVTADWGEGSSDSGSPGGQGAPSTSGDATWLHRSYDDTRWSNPGGDYSDERLATATFETTGSLVFTGNGLTELVAAWHTGEADNYGILLRNDESVQRSAILIASRASSNSSARPVLYVEYE
ncbi:MAG: DNRLRE domain-containing protein [Spirochaetaceae bacterium]|nr:MAG: DNRLRE domain-containing protein [Spirochaetaceae bacterium]